MTPIELLTTELRKLLDNNGDSSARNVMICALCYAVETGRANSYLEHALWNDNLTVVDNLAEVVNMLTETWDGNDYINGAWHFANIMAIPFDEVVI